MNRKGTKGFNSSNFLREEGEANDTDGREGGGGGRRGGGGGREGGFELADVC